MNEWSANFFMNLFLVELVVYIRLILLYPKFLSYKYVIEVLISHLNPPILSRLRSNHIMRHLYINELCEYHKKLINGLPDRPDYASHLIFPGGSSKHVVFVPSPYLGILRLNVLANSRFDILAYGCQIRSN